MRARHRQVIRAAGGGDHPGAEHASAFDRGDADPAGGAVHHERLARLQAASTSGKPVLLRLDGQAGHGVGSTATQQASKLADVYAFMLWQFGQASGATATATSSTAVKTP